jgi:large subunit ribosomal protein L3
MSFTLIGQKKGMTQVFDGQGKLVVCTVIQAQPNAIVQIKRKETDGYSAIQLGGLTIANPRPSVLTKARKGHFEKAKAQPRRVLRESLVEELDSYQLGQEISLSIFTDVKFVDVEGVTKGKGFQGVMKLYNYAGGPGAHGSGFHRHAGSTGMRSTPGRCFPGGKRASRMGGDRQTTQSLRVVAIQGDLLLVEGAVPGAKNGIVFITKSVKG